MGGIAVLLGAWLIASPFVLDYGTGDAAWSPILCGAAAIALALVQTLGRVRSSTPGWFLMAIGVWLIASSFLLADSSTASWNALGAGVLLFFLASVSVSVTESARRA